MDVSDVVVLVVGVATVLTMLVEGFLQKGAAERMTMLVARQTAAAEQQADAAEQQAAAARAQADVLHEQSQREQSAKLIAVFGGGDPQAQRVRLFNGGRYPASDIRAWYRSEDGSLETEHVYAPCLAPGENDTLPGIHTSPASVERGAPPLWLHLEYTDGRGEHREQPGLQAYQF